MKMNCNILISFALKCLTINFGLIHVKQIIFTLKSRSRLRQRILKILSRRKGEWGTTAPTWSCTTSTRESRGSVWKPCRPPHCWWPHSCSIRTCAHWCWQLTMTISTQWVTSLLQTSETLNHGFGSMYH